MSPLVAEEPKFPTTPAANQQQSRIIGADDGSRATRRSRTAVPAHRRRLLVQRRANEETDAQGSSRTGDCGDSEWHHWRGSASLRCTSSGGGRPAAAATRRWRDCGDDDERRCSSGGGLNSGADGWTAVRLQLRHRRAAAVAPTSVGSCAAAAVARQRRRGEQRGATARWRVVGPIDPRQDNNGGQGVVTSTKLDDAMDSNRSCSYRRRRYFLIACTLGALIRVCGYLIVARVRAGRQVSGPEPEFAGL
ncbi:hypothetical protein Scep_026364 [Stephania cephalantha]|uniref:Uncharacterized protein n=1 Tax=Stephania cephalantha TaxID=152367 RepID=A0AAP0EMJ7_9MAGN